jgi:hypothetical protein
MTVIDAVPRIEAARDREELELWIGIRMGELVGEFENAGVKLDDIPKALEDYVTWLRANLEAFR